MVLDEKRMQCIAELQIGIATINDQIKTIVNVCTALATDKCEVVFSVNVHNMTIHEQNNAQLFPKISDMGSMLYSGMLLPVPALDRVPVKSCRQNISINAFSDVSTLRIMNILLEDRKIERARMITELYKLAIENIKASAEENPILSLHTNNDR